MRFINFEQQSLSANYRNKSYLVFISFFCNFFSIFWSYCRSFDGGLLGCCVCNPLAEVLKMEAVCTSQTLIQRKDYMSQQPRPPQPSTGLQGILVCIYYIFCTGIAWLKLTHFMVFWSAIGLCLNSTANFWISHSTILGIVYGTKLKRSDMVRLL
jgi:hypothetical protein